MKIITYGLAGTRSRVLLLILVALIVSLSVPFALKLTQRPPQILNSIQIENQLPGTRDWQLSNPARFDQKTFHYPAIEGYASTTSIEVGQSIGFSISTTAASFVARVYRLGWYQGKGGRLIQSFPTYPGHIYAVPKVDRQTGLIEAHWPIVFTLQTDANWVSGMYLVKLTALNGYQFQILFVVRTERASIFAFVHASNTDEAYNYWGGASLYVDLTQTLKAQRAFEVSFDRPFEHNVGSGQFFWWEYPMIRWLERRGYDVSYFADIDMQENIVAHRYHHAVLIVGHSEYWSRQMRDNMQTMISKGTNVAFFSANDIFWQIRFESGPSDVLPHPLNIIVCYKKEAFDPFHGRDNKLLTVEFRNPLVNAPEQELVGATYGSWWENSGLGFPWVATNTSNWVFANAGIVNGDRFPGLVGNEYDKVISTYPMPQGLMILSSSPVVNHLGQSDVSNSTLYTAPGGARVFDAGTFQWSWGLDYSSPIDKTDVVSQKIQKITDTILYNFARD